jgi:hypothetical protein
VDVIFLNQNQLEMTPKIPLDPVSSENNVVFKAAVKWMPKKNISNAVIHKGINISRSAQDTDIKGF